MQISGLWVARPQPKWVIEGDCDGGVEARGERWTEPGFFQSYGPYTMTEWIHDSSIVLVKNPFWPGTDNIPQAKIDEVHFAMLDDTAAAWPNTRLATWTSSAKSRWPKSTASRPIRALSKELSSTPTCAPTTTASTPQAPVVDDVRVRRALSMAIDRQSLIDNVTKGGQEPAQWFARPGLAGAPTMEDSSRSGRQVRCDGCQGSNCSPIWMRQGMTADQLDLTLMYNTSSGHQAIAEAIQQMWKDNLGVNVKVVNQEWKVYLDTTKSKDTPQIFRMGWCLDYPDANNFDREVSGLQWFTEPDRRQAAIPPVVSSGRTTSIEELVEAGRARDRPRQARGAVCQG